MDYIALNDLLKQGKPELALQICKEDLQKLPVTDFHKTLEINWLPMADAVAEYIERFYKLAKRNMETVETVYCEMNGFTINHDAWFVQFFAFKQFQGIEDFDWLADYDFCEHDNALVFTKLEDIQAVFKNYIEKELWNDKIQEDAFDMAENIILFGVQELFKAACSVGKTKMYHWATIPLFITVHDSDLLFNATLT